MTLKELTKIYNDEMINFLLQFSSNIKDFLPIPTLESIITFLNGFANGLMAMLIKNIQEDEIVVYYTPDTLVKEYLIKSSYLPESKKGNTIDPNYTLITFFKNKYSSNNERVSKFIELAISCYSYENSINN